MRLTQSFIVHNFIEYELMLSGTMRGNTGSLILSLTLDPRDWYIHVNMGNGGYYCVGFGPFEIMYL